MGKGTLMTSSTPYTIQFFSNPNLYTSTYCGIVHVSCLEDGDPQGADMRPHVVCPIPGGIKNWDFVRFRYTSQDTVRILGKDTHGCDKWILKVIPKLDVNPKPIKKPQKKKPAPKKKPKKKAK